MAERVRVLHVDDDPDFAELTAELVERERDEFEVLSETGAADALDRLDDEPVHCVVSDFDMPGMDGLAFLEAVREDHPDLPFILFTGKGSEEVASEAISLGVTDYLQKRGGTSQYTVLANRVQNAVARNRAEEQAETQRVRFEALANAANVGIVVMDADSVIRFANPTVEDVLGHEPDSLVGEPVTVLMPPRLREAHLAGVDRYLRTGERSVDWSEVEFTGLHADGHEVPISVSFGEFEQGGEPYFTGIVRPAPGGTTGEGEAHGYRPLVETVADPLFLMDAGGRIRTANTAMSRWLGYDPEELVGEHVSEFMPAEDVERGTELIRGLLRDEDRESDSFEARAYAKDGEEVLIEVNLSVLTEGGEFVGTAGAVRDITERKQKERELAYQESLFRAVTETSIDGVLVVGEDREVVTWNRQFLDLWGIPEERARDAADQELLDSVLGKLERPAEFIEQVEYLYEHPTEESRDQVQLEDGRVFDRYSAPVAAEDGTYYGRVWFFRDVTERRQRERAIETLHAVTREFMAAGSEEEVAELAVSAVRDVLEMPINTVWLADESGEHLRPVAWTERSSEVIGEMPEFGPGDGLVWTAFETGESAAFEDVSTEPGRYNPETPMRSELVLPLGDVGVLAAGSTRPGAFDEMDRSLGEILAANAETAIERARRQAELGRQNDRLAEFASIVSHDLRNPLNVAEGRLQMAREEHESEHHAAAARALERMRDLIDDLLSLARVGDRIEDVEPVSLGELAGACWSNVETGDARLAVETDVTVRADRSRLAQFLENLFRNAVEHGGGAVTVTVGDLDGGFFVEDDGTGIPEDARDDVFESGYTTNETGTGFGLAIVEQIADAHDWAVRATEGRDGGARFEVTGTDRVG